GDSVPISNVNNEFTWSDGVSLVRHRHMLRAGFSLTKYQQNAPGVGPDFRRGQFLFQNDFTGHPFSDFLLGLPRQVERGVGTGAETGRSTWQSYYLEDNWRVSRKLTVNFGVRYEYYSPLVDIRDRRTAFFPLTNDFNTRLPGQIVVANSPEAKQLLN